MIAVSSHPSCHIYIYEEHCNTAKCINVVSSVFCSPLLLNSSLITISHYKLLTAFDSKKHSPWQVFPTPVIYINSINNATAKSTFSGLHFHACPTLALFLLQEFVPTGTRRERLVELIKPKVSVPVEFLSGGSAKETLREEPQIGTLMHASVCWCNSSLF